MGVCHSKKPKKNRPPSEQIPKPLQIENPLPQPQPQPKKEDDTKKKGILISDTWMAELMKHPYHSSKHKSNNLFREAGHRHLPHEGACKAL